MDDCVFNQNKAKNEGGSIYLRDGTNLLVQNFKILNSYSLSSGAGMNLFQIRDSVFFNLNFKSCKCKGSNGGLNILFSKNLKILNSGFKQNSSLGGTGIRLKNSRNITIKNAFLKNNKAYNSAGGILVELCEKIYI